MQKTNAVLSAETPDSALEIISYPPASAHKHRMPLLFVHGAYLGGWCWEEHFLPWFAERGWDAHAVSLSGHGNSRGREHLDSLSIDNYVSDIIEAVDLLPVPPILIGHSMGGMVVQKYLERAAAPAVVLMASVPPQGLIYSALGLLFTAPQLLGDLNRIMGGGEPSADSLRDALFHQPVTAEKLDRYWKHSQAESHRAIWDMTLYNLPHTARVYRAPMLVLGAQYDSLISPGQVQMTADAYGTHPEIFLNMGHAMMLERDWEQVAVRIDEWLAGQGL
ncbi:MAG: alpha/beta hydrolase [Azoarcus sp.]|jgi:non-heme chloroperoxidase|nr:alpha/beta hydrolase [Azoarcus sp.]